MGKEVLGNLGYISPIDETTLRPRVNMPLRLQFQDTVRLVAKYGRRQVRTAQIGNVLGAARLPVSLPLLNPLRSFT